MDDDDGFADLVAAMTYEVDSQEQKVLGSPTSSTPETRNASSFSSHPLVQEPENISQMMQRIRELESELARQKGINASQSPVPSQISPRLAAKNVKKPALTDLDYNIFTSKPKKDVTPPKPTAKLTLADIGLSDGSSDEDEDFAQNLSRSGRDLKRKLIEREEEELSAKKARRKSEHPSPFADFSAPEPAPKTAPPPKWKAKIVENCALSGIRIANPTMTAETVKTTIGEKQQFKLSQLSSSRAQINQKTDWFTIGVIVQKLPTKQAANGAPFSIWKLSDLEDTVHLTTLFLFADAHKEDYKIPVRTVVAILNPSIMPKKEGKEDVAISLNSPGRMLEMGFSEDMAVCKGRTKAGDACGNLVNLSKAEYCVYHLHGALQKVGSHRMELQTHFSGVQPKTSKVKEAANGYFYGGKMFTSALAPKASSSRSSKESPAAPVKPAVVSRAAQALIDEARHLVKAQMTEEEKKTLDTLTTKNSQLNQLVVTDGPGARNLVRSVTKKEIDSKPAKFITPSQLLKDHKASMEKLLAGQNKKVADRANQAINWPASLSSPGSSFAYAGKRSGTNFSSAPAPITSKRAALIGSRICLDDDDDDALVKTSFITPPKNRNLSALPPSQARALSKLQQSGVSAITKSDPNRTPGGLSARARERIEAMTSGKKNVPPPAETKARICNLSEDVELQALLNEYSKNDDLCRSNEIDYMDGYFKRSEAKEGLEEAMENTKEMECSVVTCKQCKYTAASLAEHCYRERHEHVKHKATKRFYLCRKCSKRKPSFATVMPSPCKSCGTQNFQRCGMLAYERKGPRLESEILHLRGDHSEFLNGFD